MKLLQCGFVRSFGRWGAVSALCAALGGCTGAAAPGTKSDGDEPDSDEASEDDSTPPPPFIGDKPPECEEAGQETPPSVMRRLSSEEIVRSAEVAFEMDELGETLPTGVRTPEGFRNDALVLLTSQQFVQGMDRWAEKVATKTRGAAATLAKCEAFGDQCETRFIREVGRRLMRRPLDDAQVSRFRNLFKIAKDQGDAFSVGAELVLRALLSSPQFLYRLEPTPEDGSARKLDGYELATRLSFVAWGAGPDSDLLDAAERGDLDKIEGLKTQFARLLQHPRAKQGLRTFVSEWLGLDMIPDTARDESKVPLDPELRQDMAEETFRLFEDFWGNTEAPAWELAVAPFTFTSERLGKHAGIAGAKANFARTDLADDQPRLGFLTHAGFLMAHAGADIPKVVERGLTIYKTVMCQTPVPPNASIDTGLNQRPLGPGITERMNADARAENGTCGGCHQNFDPLAYAFERFDGTGRWVEKDGNGNPLRTDGTMLWLASPTDVEEERPYEGPRDFLNILSEDARFRSCLSQKVVQYAWGRGLEPEGKDMCSVYNIHARAARKGSSLQALFAAVVEDPQFRMVRSAP